MTTIKEQYDEYSTEYLLERRAVGTNLPPEVHQAIEELLRERGAPVLPIVADEPDNPVPRPLVLPGLLAISVSSWIAFKLIAAVFPQLFASKVTHIALFLVFWALVIAGIWKYIRSRRSR